MALGLYSSAMHRDEETGSRLRSQFSIDVKRKREGRQDGEPACEWHS